MSGMGFGGLCSACFDNTCDEHPTVPAWRRFKAERDAALARADGLEAALHGLAHTLLPKCFDDGCGNRGTRRCTKKNWCSKHCSCDHSGDPSVAVWESALALLSSPPPTRAADVLASGLPYGGGGGGGFIVLQGPTIRLEQTAVPAAITYPTDANGAPVSEPTCRKSCPCGCGSLCGRPTGHPDACSLWMVQMFLSESPEDDEPSVGDEVPP